VGNAHATWSRRSWRNTKRNWLGGRRTRRRGGSDGRSSPRNSASPLRSPCSSRPLPVRQARPHPRASKPSSPPSCNLDSRKSQEVHMRQNGWKQRVIFVPDGNLAHFP
jgi:hypothetical protein